MLPLTISLVLSQNMALICVNFTQAGCFVICKQKHLQALQLF